MEQPQYHEPLHGPGRRWRWRRCRCRYGIGTRGKVATQDARQTLSNKLEQDPRFKNATTDPRIRDYLEAGTKKDAMKRYEARKQEAAQKHQKWDEDDEQKALQMANLIGYNGQTQLGAVRAESKYGARNVKDAAQANDLIKRVAASSGVDENRLRSEW